MDVLHQRRGDRQEVARQALHLLGHLERVDALADQRLVDVEVEEAHLGLGDLADRLRVHPDQLQQRDQGEAGAKHVGDPLHRDQVLVVERALDRGRRSEQRHHPLDQRFLEAGLLGGLLAGQGALPSREAGPRRSRTPAGPREPRGEARSSEWPRSRIRPTTRACAAAAVVQRPPLTGITPAASPALQGRGGDARDPRGLVQRDQGLRHRSILFSVHGVAPAPRTRPSRPTALHRATGLALPRRSAGSRPAASAYGASRLAGLASAPVASGRAGGPTAACFRISTAAGYAPSTPRQSKRPFGRSTAGAEAAQTSRWGYSWRTSRRYGPTTRRSAGT